MPGAFGGGEEIRGRGREETGMTMPHAAWEIGLPELLSGLPPDKRACRFPERVVDADRL
jgi:hypothetical protein